jgi:hypothetical protein
VQPKQLSSRSTHIGRCKPIEDLMLGSKKMQYQRRPAQVRVRGGVREFQRESIFPSKANSHFHSYQHNRTRHQSSTISFTSNEASRTILRVWICVNTSLRAVLARRLRTSSSLAKLNLRTNIALRSPRLMDGDCLTLHNHRGDMPSINKRYPAYQLSLAQLEERKTVTAYNDHSLS